MMTFRHLFAPVAVGVALLLLAPAPAAAQDSSATPAARPADVASEDAIIAALYDVISGPAGQHRDWDRMRSLFQPGARLIPTFKARDGSWQQRTWTVEEYITNAGGTLEQRGFFEREVARTTDRFGNLEHAWSTYESRWKPEDPDPFQRGINSIQLRYDGSRWWIITITWQGEMPDQPIPAAYLRSQHRP